MIPQSLLVEVLQNLHENEGNSANSGGTKNRITRAVRALEGNDCIARSEASTQMC